MKESIFKNALDDMLGHLHEALDNVRFTEGDYVILKNGKVPQKVVQTRMRGSEQYVIAVYLSSMGGMYENKVRARPASDFKRWYPPTNQKETEMAKLYQINGAESIQFGTFLAINSEGKYVLEIKGGMGVEVKAFDRSQLEEVKPYTISVVVIGKGEQHFQVSKGALEQGDYIVLDSGTIGRVRRLDTKKDDVSILPHSARKLLTEKIDNTLSPAGDAADE